jgi:tetratricopeptide (TPR) repeat protein
MTYVRRLKVAGVLLALAAVLSTSHVWGDSSRKKSNPKRQHSAKALSEDDGFSEDLADSKFAGRSVVTYQTTRGETLFAFQLKPRLEPAPATPRDYLILADTSASQVKGPLAQAAAIAEKLIAAAETEDRVSLWTVNTPRTTRDLTRGFQSPKSGEIRNALANLRHEVPLGDTDLKEGLQRALAAFEPGSDRRQVIVFLGDGMSIHNPLTAGDRNRLCESMVQKGVSFFPVPLGPHLDPQNLHGLATGTGGLVVRVAAKDDASAVAKNLHAAIAAPILYPKSFQFNGVVAEAFPTTLPPLRPDSPTLVVGRLQAGDKIACTVDGTVAGRPVHTEISELVSTPETDNFFLVGMVEQWQRAKDQPALTRADRVLASAYERNQLARADLLAQAEWALGQDKLDVAQQLFEKAKQLDPSDVEVDAGLKVVEKLKNHLLDKKQLKAELAKGDEMRLAQLAQAPEKTPQPSELAPPAQQEDLLKQQQARIAIENQRMSQAVEEAQREARRVLSRDPDAAHDILRRALAMVHDDPDLSERIRDLLSNRLETSLRSVDTQGVRIKRDREERLRLLADARRRFDIENTRAAEEERTRRRMLQFSNLMAQARYEDAYLQALAIQQDAINTGRGVPVAATAGYAVALNANNLSQVQELKRVREERFLLTMMQVERSHVPFPDEPPIQFPPAATWREITRLRKDKYENSGLTDDDPVTLRRLKDLQNKLSKPITLDKGIDPNTQLKDALEFLSDRYDITILVDSAAFKADNQDDNVEEKPVRLPKMVGVSLGTVLRLLTAQVNGTFLIRRDYVEVTTGQRAVAEKVVRVYPVADLVFPIPNSVNTRVVNQALSILGTAPGLGLNIGGPQALGGFQLGGLGLAGVGGLGLAGVGGLGLGGLGLGGLGLAGGGLGLAGGIAGAQGGFGGGLGFGGGGQVNLGAGGGQLGFGGGQLGQFGNLGGQFGLQGGDQSTILVELIRQVVGNPREWMRPGYFQRPFAPAVNPAGGQGAGDNEEDDQKLPSEILNALGYYPPARALVVKGTSRIHTNLGGGVLAPHAGGGGMGLLDRQQNGALVIAPKKDRERLGLEEQVASRKKIEKEKKPPLGDKKELEAMVKLDPKKVWEDALTKGHVTDPGLIIAVADFLGEVGKYDHLAEFLKADLRLGIVVRPWVYESLALALEATNAAPEEIERARLSAVDLQPQDAQGYLRASKAMGDLKNYDRAVAFCRQASLLQPNASYPYEEALLYAELARDPAGMEWAAGHLLRQDWPVHNQDLHSKARAKLKSFADALARENRANEAQRVVQATQKVSVRDLIIRLTWQGSADLDLEIREPIGTICSFMHRQTPGGGVLLGDTLSDVAQETYVAAQAYSGEYQITLRRIWGRPLGGRATVEIIEHQGSPQETRRRETVVFDRSHTLTLTLEDGRRTSAAYVPPPATVQRPESTEPQELSGTEVFTKLRGLADPEFVGMDSSSMRAGVASLGLDLPSLDNRKPSGAAPRQVLIDQTKLPGLVQSNNFDLTAQATYSDKETLLKFTPIFNRTNAAAGMPAVTNPLVPGVKDPLQDW